MFFNYFKTFSELNFFIISFLPSYVNILLSIVIDTSISEIFFSYPSSTIFETSLLIFDCLLSFPIINYPSPIVEWIIVYFYFSLFYKAIVVDRSPFSFPILADKLNPFYLFNYSSSISSCSRASTSIYNYPVYELIYDPFIFIVQLTLAFSFNYEFNPII
jgi:hypothetical protein